MVSLKESLSRGERPFLMRRSVDRSSMKARQFTLQLLLLVVTVVASFFAGYRLGFSNGREVRFEDLERLITETIQPSSRWAESAALSDFQFEQLDTLSVADSVLKLTELGEPDDTLRTMNGIEVMGSALTDDHAKAICKLTDKFKPARPDEFLSRGITHTGKNAADHSWQTAFYQTSQRLELHDGRWRIVESRCGYGDFGPQAVAEAKSND